MADSINKILGNSSLFNTASSLNSKSNNSLFDNFTINSSGNALSDFSSIKSGSYKKLLKAYYSQTGSGSEAVSKNNGLTKSEQKQVTLISSDMVELKNAADALKTTGKNSLFKAGEKGYDYDKLLDAVKSLVDSYNSAITDTSEISVTEMDKKVTLTKNMLAKNSSLLKDAGITIKDDKLSIDEAKFKKADINVLKTLFNGSGSLADKLSTRASSIYSISQSMLGKSTNLYTKSASLRNSSSSGNLVDTTL